MADYELDCEIDPTDTCPGVCLYDWQCTMCDTRCPEPLPNSHLVSSNCSADMCNCLKGHCEPVPYPCPVYGTCKYDCDDGYIWDGEACVLPVVGQTPHKNIFKLVYAHDREVKRRWRRRRRIVQLLV